MRVDFAAMGEKGMSAGLSKWGEWIRWGSTIAVIVAFAVFDNRYVAKTVYEKDRDTLASSLAAVQTSLALLQAQAGTLQDHETRLRSLERGGRQSASLAVDIPRPNL